MSKTIQSLMCAVSMMVLLTGFAEAEETNFSNPTVDLGIVVSDADKALKFYVDAVGFTKAGSFDVPASTATDAGLTNNKPLSIHVLKLGSGPGATSIKIMEVPGVKSRKPNNKYIHSQFGFSYLTIHVKSTEKAMEKLKKAGVKPIAKGPVELPASLGKGVYLTVLQDPDGNLVELVGP